MNFQELNDEQLMILVAGGDAAAFEVLYDRHAATVMGRCLRVIQDEAAAEETVQEAFWRVWRSAGLYQPERGPFKHWLLQIAHRLALDVVRRRQVRPQPLRREQDLEWAEQQPDATANVAEAAWMSMKGQSVRKAMAALPVEQRRIIDLAFFQGLTRQEIASRTGIPLGTVHTRARLALGNMQQSLILAGIDG
ncbi:MAG: sigma-70 family RNA polymerase sigma factor [Chloroflexota bacterium]